MKEKNIVEEYCINKILELKGEVTYLKLLYMQLEEAIAELEEKIELLNNLKNN